MNEQIFNYVHHLPEDSSGCHQVSLTAWYSILNDVLPKREHLALFSLIINTTFYNKCADYFTVVVIGRYSLTQTCP